MAEKNITYTGKDIIKAIKEDKAEKYVVKCAYIHLENEDEDDVYVMRFNWGKRK